MSIRDLARQVALGVVPSQYPSAAFQSLTGGKWSPGHGSACGYLPSLILEAIGCRDGRILNRDEPDYGLKYTNGDNISRLENGAKALGCWETFGDGGGPQIMDIILCSNGPPLSEHVFLFDGEEADDSGALWWHGLDAGHPSAGSADTSLRQRTADGLSLEFIGGPRKVVGWINLDLVPRRIVVLEGADLVPSESGTSPAGLLGLAFVTFEIWSIFRRWI